jgi:hypothetical protein
VIARTSVVLFVLLPLSLGACSDGNASSTSSVPESAGETVVTSPPTLQANSIPPAITVQSVPASVTTAVAVTGVPTTVPRPTIATSTTFVPGSTAPQQVTTTPSTPAPAGATALVDKDCAAENNSGYDLLHVKVESLVSRYRLTAQYSGDTFQHDILISFDLGASIYLVTGELFEDGKGVAQVASSGSSEGVFLDPPQTISPGLVDLTVRNDQIGGISGTPFDVTVLLKVDGVEIETCK